MSYISSELRRQVLERAQTCCEYCRLSQQDSFFQFEIDHIIAEKHGGMNESQNLCLSCPDYNSFKGSDIGSIDRDTGRLTPLFNPREHVWSEHFRLDDGVMEPLTPEGRVTVFLLRLNDPDRIADRKLLMDMGRYPCEQV